ncbi:MAG TPA: hypothetical protein VGF55_13140 [Gemmataceae bacterium]|jgi:WD40 repeat protein
MQILRAAGVTDFVSIVRFTPDGGRLVAGSADQCVRVWDLATGAVVATIDRRPTADHRAVVLSPDGTHVVTGDGAGIRVWDAATGGLVRTITLSRGNPYTVTVTPGGRELVASNDPYAAPGLQFWDAATGEPLPAWSMPSPIDFSRLAFSPDGRRLAAHAGAGVAVWDVVTHQPLFDSPAAPTLGTAALAWAPAGRTLASGSGNVLYVWDVLDGREVARLKQPRKHFQSAAFSPDGRTLVTVSNEATARVWDAATWRERQAYAWGAGPLKCVAFAADGLRLAAGGEKGQAVVWDV